MTQKFLTYYKNTFGGWVFNDGGSHVETSSICVVPLEVAKMCMRGSQAQPLQEIKLTVNFSPQQWFSQFPEVFLTQYTTCV